MLKQVFTQINLSTHVKPIIYQDKELGFVTENQAEGVKQFVQESKTIFGNQTVQTMLHDSVFRKLDIESKLFKVLWSLKRMKPFPIPLFFYSWIVLTGMEKRKCNYGIP